MWGFHKFVADENQSGKDVHAEHRDTVLSRRRSVVIWIERLLLTSGLALVVFHGVARMEGWLASRAALRQFAGEEAGRTFRPNRSADNFAPDGEAASESLQLPSIDFSLWDERRVKAYSRSSPQQPGAPLAVLRIPKIQLEAPLFDGTDELTLNHAVGRIAGTAHLDEPGNIGIAGHRDGFFRGLKDVSIGDAIELKTRKETTTYRVDRIQIVTPRQVEVLRPTAIPSLTLVTCYPFYFIGSAPQRYIVTASLLPEKNGESEPSHLSPPATARNSTRRKQMNLFKKTSVVNKGVGAIVLALLAFGTAAAQDSTVTTITHGQPSYDTQVKDAEIVYVGGNDLVLKLENGRVEHLVVPDSDKFFIDGKQVSVRELVPGTKLTQSITTTTTPRYVNSVRTIEGKVWHVSAPTSLILSLPDNTNQIFKVPSHATFVVNGKEKTVFDLKKGMKIKATVVTDEEHTVIERNKFAFGKAPEITAPRDFGLLLFAMPQQPQVTLASADQPAQLLPETGSSLPLFGLLGTLAIAMAVALRVARRGYAL